MNDFEKNECFWQEPNSDTICRRVEDFQRSTGFGGGGEGRRTEIKNFVLEIHICVKLFTGFLSRERQLVGSGVEGGDLC